MCKYTLITVFCLDVAVFAYNSRWNYADESTWPVNFCQEGGKRQSPIDIQVNKVVKDCDRLFIKHGRLKLDGYDQVLLSGYNSGHTRNHSIPYRLNGCVLQTLPHLSITYLIVERLPKYNMPKRGRHGVTFSTNGDQSMHPTVTGGPLKHTYHLKEISFHWISEHSIDGVKYPMEIHFVHLRTDLEMKYALNTKNGLAVVSVFCNVTETMNEDEKDDTEEIMEYIPKLMKPGDRISGVIINLKKLLSTSSGSYFTYVGSLTTPACEEVVVWIIFEEPIHILDFNYEQFTDAGAGYNFRSLQKIDHHVVYQPPDSFISTPAVIRVLVEAVNSVARFFKNVTSVVSNGFKYGS